MNLKNLAARRGKRSEVETGLVLMVIAMLWMPGIDAIAKALSATIPIGQVVWSRFLFQMLFLAPILVFGARRPPVTQWGWHMARGVLIALATLFFFSSLRFLPLADAIAIFFVEPLILTLLSGFFLREPVGWRRLMAVAVGFIGALIVIRPSWEIFGFAAVLPLIGATFFAVYLLLTRHLATKSDPVTMQFLTGVFGFAFMSAMLVLGGFIDFPVIAAVWPTTQEWMLLIGLGVIATSGHLLIVFAFQRAPASVLAPFQYLEIIGATILGYVFFNDFPDMMKWLGISIIIGSGIYVFHRERKRGQETAG